MSSPFLTSAMGETEHRTMRITTGCVHGFTVGNSVVIFGRLYIVASAGPGTFEVRLAPLYRRAWFITRRSATTARQFLCAVTSAIWNTAHNGKSAEEQMR